MDIKMLARLGAVALVGVSAVSAVMLFSDTDPVSTNSRRLGEQPTEPLGPMLMRCVELGEAAVQDAGCRKTWMENRRRFLGHQPRMQDKPVRTQGSAGAPVPSNTKDAPQPGNKPGSDPLARPFNADGLGAK